jgi:outer membrane protein TolC
MTHYQGLSWTSAQKAAMNADQLQVLGMPLGLPGTGDVAALSTTDVAALGTDIGTLGSDAAAALGTDQISALSSAQVALLSSSAVAVLSLAQVQALGSNLGALSVSALGAIAPDRIAGLGTDQITSLGISSASPANRAFVGMSFQPGAGLSVESDIRSLMARREASDRDLAASQLDLLEEFNTDWLGFNAVRERLDAVLDALGDTRAISRSYERQYQAGRKSWLDVMNLLREQLQLELQQVDLESSLIALSRKLQVRAAGLAAWGSE